MTIVFRCDPRIDHILPRPVPARRGLPEWLRSMPMAAFSDPQGTDVRTVKQCPPFVDAMSAGFLMPLACDVEVTDAGFRWDWTDIPDDTPSHVYRSPLSFHLAEQLTGSPVFEPDSLAVKFMNHWLIETEPGCSLLITHPVNRLDLPFRSLTGLVNTDLYHPGLFTNPLAVDFSACDASLVAGSFAAGESRVLPQLCDSHLRHERREEAAVEASGTATGDPAVA